MVFQCYYSAALVVTSAVIWACSDCELEEVTIGSVLMGCLFACLWIGFGVVGYVGVVNIGLAVAVAIWNGMTVIISFMWGVIAFGTEVNHWLLAMGALVLLSLGVALAAASYIISSREIPKTPNTQGREDRRILIGMVCSIVAGLCNGSVMVPLNCFQDGCPALGVEPYTGGRLPVLAFLPSLAFG